MNRGGKQYCILFYKYHPLTDEPAVLETYRRATEALCTSLQLTGRVLIGLSNDGEGINGTLAGAKGDLDAYVSCMLGEDATDIKYGGVTDQGRFDAIVAFREASRLFFADLDVPELFLDSPSDFKWSTSSAGKEDENWFPDLNIKIVKEMVSTGGAFSDISTGDTSVGYLTPRQWHEEMRLLMEKRQKKENAEQQLLAKNDGDDGDEVETILIDVRNHKECQIGSFAPGISIDPNTKTFAQFPQWVKNNSRAEAEGSATSSSRSGPSSSLLNNKRILMFCTGGIRCEKASAYVRRAVPQNKGVYHLKGGIHKYLEEFGRGGAPDSDVAEEAEGVSGVGSGCMFVGKNFVFDRRGALDARGHGTEGIISSDDVASGDAIVGKCQYCRDPHDVFRPEIVCTVCREPVLVCEKCRSDLIREQRRSRGLEPLNGDAVETDGTDAKRKNGEAEYHCEDHFHLKTCYFTGLRGFGKGELEHQIEQLQTQSKQLEGEGKKGKQRRRTLRKQIEKIKAHMRDQMCDGAEAVKPAILCRHCGSPKCTSECWGFHGGNARMVNKTKSREGGGEGIDSGNNDGKGHKQRSRAPSNQRPAKQLKRLKDMREIEALQLSKPPSEHRNEIAGIRVPPPAVRVLSSGVKGQWVGKTVRWLFDNVFGESLRGCTQEERDGRLEELIAAGLIRINGSTAKASDTLLQNMDTIERIIHWHEPPILVPAKISLTKHTLPDDIVSSSAESTVPLLYCVCKPSSVPVHPAGPYYANSLLLMVEAQEGLSPRTLIPLHRIDRATSGVLLCTNATSVARAVQGRMARAACRDAKDSPVRKLYLARVRGKFPSAPSETTAVPKDCENFASISWSENNAIEVDAPIAVGLEPKANDSGPNKDEGDEVNSMMRRKVCSDGKKSTSRFRFISYDPETNQSLVSCCPVTGRGHQLRVHLQFMGYPIHNDVEYGGHVPSDVVEERLHVSARSISAATSQCLQEESVTAEEVKSAMQLCGCCNGGPEGIGKCFNRAQLLGSGHAIDLHAYKYRISFERKETRERTEEKCGVDREGMDRSDATTVMEFATHPPSWASAFPKTAWTSVGWLN